MRHVELEIVVEQIPVLEIEPSATNPRKHIDQAALEELAASIKAVGIQVPLSLRAKGLTDRYEIVGGERRWRAALLAGLQAVPAIVRAMTDEDFREAQLVDNLQRADLSPMEEAEGYESLQSAELPIEVLAAKVGKTVQYVAQRLRLLQLVAPARDALRAGVLNISIALLIARLDQGTQEKATLYAVDPKRFMQGDLAAKIKSAKSHVDRDDSYWRCATETQMRSWISEHTLLPLKPAAWDLADAELLPAAGACTSCPKRSGNASMLFGDLAGDDDTCTDPDCYRRKEKAFVKIQLKADSQAVRLLDSESHLPLKEGATTLKAGQWIIAKAKSCPAVIVGITENGKRLHVCPDQKCKVHKHEVRRPMKAGETVSYELQQKEREAKEQAYLEAERPIRLILYAEIRKKLTGTALLRAVIAGEIVNGGEVLDLAKLRGVKLRSEHDWEGARKGLEAELQKLADADLEGMLADARAASAVMPHGFRHDERKSDRADLWALGKRVGVDCDAIVKRLDAEVPKVAKVKPAAKEKPAAKPKAKAAKSAPAKASRVRKLSPASRKRIADAMRKRWADRKKKAVRR